MTVKEFYGYIGVDYENVVSRLRKEERVKKFLMKFADDQSCTMLCDSVKQKNMTEAFRWVHALKGISQDLSFINLYIPASRLSERLQESLEYDKDVEILLSQIQSEYSKIIEAIRKLM